MGISTKAFSGDGYSGTKFVENLLGLRMAAKPPSGFGDSQTLDCGTNVCLVGRIRAPKILKSSPNPRKYDSYRHD